MIERHATQISYKKVLHENQGKKNFKFSNWECLNVRAVPTYKMHNIGTVPMFKMHNVGTIPMFKMQSVGTPKI